MFPSCANVAYAHDTLISEVDDNLWRHEVRCRLHTMPCHHHLAPKSVRAKPLSPLTLPVCSTDSHPAAGPYEKDCH